MEGIDDKQRCTCLRLAHHARRWAAKRIMGIVPQVDDVRLVAVDPQGDLRLLERY
jgi:hypothetical protein